MCGLHSGARLSWLSKFAKGQSRSGEPTTLVYGEADSALARPTFLSIHFIVCTP